MQFFSEHAEQFSMSIHPFQKQHKSIIATTRWLEIWKQQTHADFLTN